jgi:signal peptidase II
MPESGAAAVPSRAVAWWSWLIASAGVVALDQLTKWLVQQVLAAGQSIRVLPVFDLVLVYNPGAAFSFLSSAPGWQRELFVGIALAASALILYLLRRHPHDRMFCFALSLILGGAIGNLIDRLVLGAVVDFLLLHAMGYHWPAFNLADSAITCGAGLLIWDALRRPRVRRGTEPQRHRDTE